MFGTSAGFSTQDGLISWASCRPDVSRREMSLVHPFTYSSAQWIGERRDGRG